MLRQVRITGQGEQGISGLRHAILAIVLLAVIAGSLIQLVHILTRLHREQTISTTLN